MKKMTALLTLILVTSLAPAMLAARPEAGAAPAASGPTISAPQEAAAGQQAPKQPGWKSRDEYDAFNAMANEKDPNKRISLAEAFVQKFTNSDFKDGAYQVEMGAYAQLNAVPKAIDAGRKALEANPDNLDALAYLSYVFPFVTKPDAAEELARGEREAKHGLELLQKLQKPANVTDEQFSSYVKPKRAVFNNAVGFAALQRKDYAASVTALKAASEDSPSDSLAFSLLGQAYLYSTPPDFDNALWNLSRGVALAKAANSPNLPQLEKFYGQVYVGRHGSNAGQNDLVNEAASSVNPPAGFKVAPPEKHAATGNPNIDAFYQIEDALRVGGDQAQKQWDGLKGQPLGLNGFVDSVEKGTDAGTYLVRVALDQSKAGTGVYNIELKDSQTGVEKLSKGDPVRFQGTISAYTVTPSFALTLDNVKINDDDLAAAAAKAKSKPKAPARKPPVRRRPAARKTPTDNQGGGR
jgi:tetratricopeptide (TPR) repeat protein